MAEMETNDNRIENDRSWLNNSMRRSRHSRIQRDKLGRNMLHLAVEHKESRLFFLLLKHNANPNQTDKRGFTPLHSAAISGLDCYLSPLLIAGASINVVDNNGFCALQHAVNKGYGKCAQILLCAGANPLKLELSNTLCPHVRMDAALSKLISIANNVWEKYPHMTSHNDSSGLLVRRALKWNSLRLLCKDAEAVLTSKTGLPLDILKLIFEDYLVG